MRSPLNMSSSQGTAFTQSQQKYSTGSATEPAWPGQPEKKLAGYTSK